jgi:oligopeptide/dipeptide ABC transporter ATP-binding protein
MTTEPDPAAEPDVILRADRVVKQFRVVGHGRARAVLHAVDDVDLVLRRGETVGLIGESGSGKSTLGRMLLRLYQPTGGRIWLDGQDITELEGEALRRMRRRMNMVFQNPYSSMSPRRKIASIVTEPLDAFGVGSRQQRREEARAMLARVGIPASLDNRYPDAVSGGQLQRVAIARALILHPEVLLADEPTASLDVSIRAQVINLLRELATERQLSTILISHDLRTVSNVADSLAVMYLGKIVEHGSKASIEKEALHPYTQRLIAAMPRLDAHRHAQRASVRPGDLPSAIDRPSGCHFHPRCPLMMDICRQEYPSLEEKRPGHFVACHAVTRADSEKSSHLGVPRGALK